jgi:hypothetical protein
VLGVATLPHYNPIRYGYGPVELDSIRGFGVASVARPLICKCPMPSANRLDPCCRYRVRVGWVRSDHRRFFEAGIWPNIDQ